DGLDRRVDAGRSGFRPARRAGRRVRSFHAGGGVAAVDRGGGCEGNMSVPLSQMWTVATYVLGQRLRGRQRYPLVLMLEPLRRGFRVTTNTTLFDGANPLRMREFFDAMMDLGVEGMMVSPGYSYSKAPDQVHFLRRQRAHDLFRAMLANPKKRWRFNQSPIFLQFLMGKHDFECTPWGNPTYNLFGWQRPCYLLQEGYAASFKELIETTRWEDYGKRSGNPKCRDCMVH